MDKKTDFQGNGTSLAVRQFVAFIRGEDAPHEPINPWRVEEVWAKNRYCLNCYGDHWFDVVMARTVDGKPLTMKRCRGCGAEA